MAFIETIIFAFIGLAIASLIGAIILRAATKWVLKTDTPFGEAYITFFIACLINFAISVVMALLMGEDVTSLLMFPIGFLIQSGIISARLQTTFGQACQVSLAMIAVWFGIVLGVGGIIFAIISAMG